MYLDMLAVQSYHISNTHTHTLTIVFSYTQFPRWEGRWWNGKAKESAEKYCSTLLTQALMRSKRWQNDQTGGAAAGEE